MDDTSSHPTPYFRLRRPRRLGGRPPTFARRHPTTLRQRAMAIGERWRRRVPSWSLSLGFAIATVWVATGYIRSKITEAAVRATGDRQGKEG
jgi:hypothetical protein